MPLRILEYRVKFFDGRPDEITDCSDDKIYQKWLRGETAASIVKQGTAQQEILKFEVTKEPIKNLIRISKTTKFGLSMRTENESMGYFAPGKHTFVFKKRDIERHPQAAGDWTLVTLFQDTTGREYLSRKTAFKVV
jgi:hypothetical protein